MNESYIQVPVDQLLAACESYIAARKRYLDEQLEESIRKQMVPRWFGLIKAPTRDEVIKDMYTDTTEMFWIENTYSSYIVKELINMCKVPNVTTVNVSASDAMVLKGYLSV